MAASPAVLADRRGGPGCGGNTAIAAFVVDNSTAEEQAFATTAATRGTRVYRFHGDVGDVYQHRLAPQWRQQGPLAVAGLTRIEPLFYLERLAWDAGMRVVVLGRHAAQGTKHEFRGPQSTLDFFHDAARAVEWPSALALALSQVPGAVSPLRPLSAVRDALIANDPALFSWVLAPTRREFSV